MGRQMKESFISSHFVGKGRISKLIDIKTFISINFFDDFIEKDDSINYAQRYQFP
jgi:hypothetical protein